MFLKFRHRPNYKTRKIEASSLRSSREAGSGHGFKVFFPVSSGIEFFPVSSGTQGIFPVRSEVQGIVVRNIVCCIFPAIVDVQGMILASSISFVGALVTECFTISKERKMMSFFHPERN